MRSTRLATAAVAAGAALLGFSTVGVSAIGGQLEAAAPATQQQQQQQQQDQPLVWRQHDDVGFERHHDHDRRAPGV